MATLVVAMSFTGKPPAKGSLVLCFDHYVGDRVLQLDTATYTNELGQAFTISKFKYYIGNIAMQGADGGRVAFEDYHLVDEEDEQSKKIDLGHLPAGEYTGITFTLGVDSIDNCSGAQSGALDPVNAMFWAWNTGYIFLKMEGHSPMSNSPGHIFEYHIGGYRAPYNCIRHIALHFHQPLIVGASEMKELHIKTDAAEILKTPSTLDFSKLSSVTDFHNATTIADNYADMFSMLSQK